MKFKKLSHFLLSAILLANSVAFGAADDIARLYSFAPGTPIRSSEFNAEFNQLVNTMNNKFGRGVANTLTGNNTFTGTSTFNGAATFGSSSTFNVLSLFNAGVDIEMTGDIGSPTNGQLWYNSTGNQLKARINGSTVVLGASTPPAGYIFGNRPIYSTANTITLATGMSVTDDTGLVTIATTTTETCALNTSGAGGLDTGSEAANTWYYPWLIRKSSDGTVDCLFSLSRTAPTMPSGYDQKRRIPIAVRNDSGSSIIPFMVGQGWPESSFIEYNVAIGDHITVASNNVLSAGTASSFTAVDLSSLVPPISTIAYLKGTHLYSAAGGQFRIRATGETHNGYSIDTPPSSTNSRPSATWHQITNASQSIDYMNSGTTTQNWLWVVGFTVNE